MMKRIAVLLAVLAVALSPLMVAAPVQAQSGNQWRMDFFNNPNWEGGASLTQYATLINFNWGFGSPAPNVPVDYFTGRFTTDAWFYAGTYRFSILADDEFRLIIDGTVVFDTVDRGQSGKQQVFDVGLAQGNHNVRVDYRELTQSAYVYVDWQFLKDGTPIPPSQPVPPPSGNPTPWSEVPQSQTSVKTQFGDFTPCIQQGIHQSNCFQSDGAWNSPNLGSIQLEPQIQIWMNCEPPDSDKTWVSDNRTNPVTTKSFRCSKTLAGYFPR
jgi:hypothetical protein